MGLKGLSAETGLSDAHASLVVQLAVRRDISSWERVIVPRPQETIDFALGFAIRRIANR